MFPELTTGMLKWMRMGANVINAIVQILSYEKISHVKDYRYRFLISDGDLWSYAVLAKGLDHMVTNKELEKFTVVQIDKYVCKKMEKDEAILVLNLTVLAPGNKVNGKILNPFDPAACAATNKTITDMPTIAATGYSKAAHDSSMMFPLLTTPGAIGRILDEEEDVANLVAIIISYKKVAGYYKLIIFDGMNGWPFVMLGTHLNHMISNKELKKFSIVQINKYEYKQVTSGPKMIVLLKITILDPGKEGDDEKFRNFLILSSCGGGTAGNAVTNACGSNGAAGGGATAVNVVANTCGSNGATAVNAVTNTCGSNGAAGGGATAVNVVANTCGSKQKTASDHYSSLLNGCVPQINFNQFLLTMFPEVAAGAINRIQNGEEVTNAVVQILGCVKIPGRGTARYRLHISDGVTGYPFAMLGTQLNHMVVNKKLLVHTIVRIEKYELPLPINARKLIVLLDLTVLVPGNEVNKKLGNPVNSCNGAAGIANTSAANDDKTNGKAVMCSNDNSVAANDVDKMGDNVVAANDVDKADNVVSPNDVDKTGDNVAVHSNDNAVAANDSANVDVSILPTPSTQLHVTHPELSNGAINRILNEENVSNVIIQILGCQKIPGAGNDRYRLLISDGVTGFLFAMLGTQLNHMVVNKELEKFTIVRVDKYVCYEVQAWPKVIILLKLTVLVPGNEVNETIGNPVSSSADETATVNDVPETSYSNSNAVAANDSTNMDGSGLSVSFTQLHIRLPELSNGALNRIINGEEVANVVLQILGCKKIPGAGNDRYRLLISDGVTGCPFAMLGTQLNHMVVNKKLEKFTIVRVDKYVCNEVQAERKVIILLKLTVLVPGNEVNEKLGNPVSSSNGASSTSNKSSVNNIAETGNAVAANDSTKTDGSELSVPFTQLHITFPKLSNGAINRIIDGEDVANVVIQILGIRKIPGAGDDRYRLLLWDGVTDCPFAMLGTQLNHMVVNKELEKFSIVRVDKYVCNLVTADRKVIILLYLTVLVPGNAVNKLLGHAEACETSCEPPRKKAHIEPKVID